MSAVDPAAERGTQELGLVASAPRERVRVRLFSVLIILALGLFLAAKAEYRSPTSNDALYLYGVTVTSIVLLQMAIAFLRYRRRPGAHERTARYARSALAARGADEALAVFDDLRRLRNKAEYDVLLVSETTAREALAYARAIVEVVEADLS